MAATERSAPRSASLGAVLGLALTVPLILFLSVARAIPGRPGEFLPPLFVAGVVFGSALGYVAPAVARWRRAVLGSLGIAGFLGGVALYVAWVAFRAHGHIAFGPTLVLAALVSLVAAPAMLPPVIASALLLERSSRHPAR